jgi:hypothetical protein
MNKQAVLDRERRRSVSVNTTLARNHIPTLRTEIDRIRSVSSDVGTRQLDDRVLVEVCLVHLRDLCQPAAPVQVTMHRLLSILLLLLLAAGAAAAAAAGGPGSADDAEPAGTSAAPAEWVSPAGLPAGHNGGTLEQLARPAGPSRPNVLFVLWDDYGWAGAGYKRAVATPEVQTPTMDALVAEGVDLAQSYVFYCCSPTRSSLQSGRNPIHVNVLNADPDTFNASDPVSGAAGVARNMTGIGTKMAAAGYSTHFVGKWDAG